VFLSSLIGSIHCNLALYHSPSEAEDKLEIVLPMRPTHAGLWLRPDREMKVVGQRTLSHTTHTHKHTSRPRAIYPEQEEESVEDVSRRLSPAFHMVWGRVVPDIPDFCRELVAALAEE
jgi:hypothetical protein